MRCEIARMTTEKIITMVESAFISGVTPKRIIEKICMGSVVDARPAPDVKKAMMNSSTDNVKASNDPATTAGIRTGMTIRLSVTRIGAPRSVDASTIDQSKLLRRARTTEQTKARLNTTWLTMMVCRPMVTSSSEKKLNSAMARTMSGMIIGAKIMVSRKRPLRLRISTPMASKVPNIAARNVDTTATNSVLSAA